MGIGRDWREDLLEKRLREIEERRIHSDMPEWVDQLYEQPVNNLSDKSKHKSIIRLSVLCIIAAALGIIGAYLYLN